MADQRDLELRKAALVQVRELQRQYDDLIPLPALAEGFQFEGGRISFGSFYSGIYRPKELEGPAALCVVTAPPTDSPAARLRAATDNRALVAARDLAVPLIYFRGIAPGQYAAVAPAFVVHVDEDKELAELQAGLPIADTTPAGIVSDDDVRRYATREALFRLHQHRFRTAVIRAYTTRCAVCRLREASLLEAAHIIDDRGPQGVATVVNGISLCAIHHLAYDRNLLGIDPTGVVHIARRLLDEVDGPMLQSGLQGFHGTPMLQPSRRDERPDPERLEMRFEQFSLVA